MYTANHTFNPNPFSREQSTSREENSAQGWLSVDPLADKYPSYSPYNFVLNNPVSYQDPNGMWVEDGDGNWIAQEGDGAETLAQDAGISKEEAYRVMEEQGYGTYTDGDGVIKSAVDPGDVVVVSNGASPPSQSETRNAGKVFFSSEEFWSIEPTYDREDLYSEAMDRAKSIVIDQSQDRIMKGGRTPFMLDAPALLRQKMIFGAKGRLKTIGPGSTFIVPLVDGGDTVGLFYLEYTIGKEFKSNELFYGNYTWSEDLN